MSFGVGRRHSRRHAPLPPPPPRRPPLPRRRRDLGHDLDRHQVDGRTVPPITASGLRFAIAFPVLALIVARRPGVPLRYPTRPGPAVRARHRRLLRRPVRAHEPRQRRDPLRARRGPLRDRGDLHPRSSPSPCSASRIRGRQAAGVAVALAALAALIANQIGLGGERPPARRARPARRRGHARAGLRAAQARRRRDQPAHAQRAADGPRRAARSARPACSLEHPDAAAISAESWLAVALPRRDRLGHRLPRLLPAAARAGPGAAVARLRPLPARRPGRRGARAASGRWAAPRSRCSASSSAPRSMPLTAPRPPHRHAVRARRRRDRSISARCRTMPLTSARRRDARGPVTARMSRHRTNADRKDTHARAEPDRSDRPRRHGGQPRSQHRAPRLLDRRPQPQPAEDARLRRGVRPRGRDHRARSRSRTSSARSPGRARSSSWSRPAARSTR